MLEKKAEKGKRGKNFDVLKNRFAQIITDL